MPDLPLARKMWRTLEPYHSLSYFTPHRGAYHEAGVSQKASYFAARSAPLGVVPAEVVIATFFNFHPVLVRSVLPAAWEVTTPEAMIAARLRVVDEGLRAVLGEQIVDDPAVSEAADLARIAAEAAEPLAGGRALYAAHASLAWPEPPHLALWHAITLLREFRGDGHIAALVVEGLDACEALVSHAASGDGIFSAADLMATRGWSAEEWQAATDRLRDRGVLDATGALTGEGTSLRFRLEDVTDRAAAVPWHVLGPDRGERLRHLVRPLSRRIVESGVLTAAASGLA